MRTTVTLDADTESIIRRQMATREMSFKQAINEAIRAGAAPSRPTQAVTTEHSSGTPTVPLDRALQLAGEFEDEQLVRKHREVDRVSR